MTVRPPPNSIHPKSLREWRAWLTEHHGRGEGVWLITYKKGLQQPRLEYDEAVTEAICFGWIDSKPRKLDDARSMLWYAPRKAGSGWSRLNKQRVARAISTHRMTAAGLARVNEAKKDGSWAALDAVENLEIPEDLAKAFSKHKSAAEKFEAFPRSVKRSVLEWIGNAKTAPTRAKRVEETASLAAKNVRANQWRT